MARVDPSATEHVAPPGTAQGSTPRSRVRRGMLGLVAGVAVVGSVLALAGLSSTPAATTTAAPAPAVSLAAVQQGANQALQSLSGSSAAAPAAANNAAAPAASSAVQVAIQNYAFSPAALSIPVGTTVVWTNKDSAPHTVTVSSGPVKFNSPTLQQGDTFTYTFTQAGTYDYYCAVHPNMTASVTVSGSTPTTTTAPPPTSATTTMSMPSTTSASGGDGACLVSGVLTPLIQHINSAHLGESPGQQVQDLLNLNQYVLTHTTLIENMLNPLTNGGLMNVLTGVLTPLVQHINSAHLGESPGQQVQDLLNVNQYVLTHTTLIENMIKPLEAASC
jgi:plastocyanin